MRDILLAGLVFLSLPFVLWRPFYGVLVWTWLGYLNPHRFVWGFASRLPLSEFVAGATLLGWLFSREPKKLPRSFIVLVWLLFIAWMCTTTFLAELPEDAQFQLGRVLKIQVVALLAVVLTRNRERLRALVWVTALSIGFFGIKGGLWVLLTGGGGGRVWGPQGTYIGGNNELALALLMVLPLMLFLFRTSTRRIVRIGLACSMFLIAFAIAGSFSRGAAVAAVATLAFLGWRSKRRIPAVLAGIVALSAVLAFMPESWFDRIETIGTYQEDTSAQQRLNTWTFAWRYALDHPVAGGGFLVFRSIAAYEKYAPRADIGWAGKDAHNIYLEVLAEHGFTGLFLFLVLGFAAWRALGAIVKQGRSSAAGGALPADAELARMLQASLVAFAVGGMFLSLAYFDLPYSIVGMTVVLSTHLATVGTVATPNALARPLRRGGVR